jgi:hypothetical protein
MSVRSESRAARKEALLSRKDRRARTPAERVAVRFDRWRRIIADLPRGLADAETEQMLTLINTRIQHLEGGDGR